MTERHFVDGTTVLTTHKPKRISNTGYVGIHYMLTSKTHQVVVKSTIIGWRTDLADAIALQEEAKRHVADGTFDVWFAIEKSKRRTYNRK